MSTWKMDWKENDIVKAEDMNRIEENIHNAQETLDTKLDTSGDGSNLSSKFTETSIRENVNSGDSLMTIMGKIKKWFSDLKPLAFKEKVSMEDLEQTVQTMVNNALQTSSVANNLTTINEKMVLGAPMGKELSERISELNQNLTIKYFRYISDFMTITSSSTLNDIVNRMPNNSILEQPFYRDDVPNFLLPLGIGSFVILRISKGLDEYVSITATDLVSNQKYDKTKYGTIWTEWKTDTLSLIRTTMDVQLTANQRNIVIFDLSSYDFNEVIYSNSVLVNTDTNAYAQITCTCSSAIDSAKKCVSVYSDTNIIARIALDLFVK